MLLRKIKYAMKISIMILFLTDTTAVFAESNMQIYTQAPSPEVLAQTLFPKRYRGIILNDNNSIPATTLASESSASYEQQNNMFGLLIKFKYDSTTILEPSLPLLDSVGKMLKLEKTANRSIVIEGHADATGSQDYNQGLSERRARAIRRYLVSVFEINPARLVVIGKGELELHDKNNSANPINRRVVFKPLTNS